MYLTHLSLTNYRAFTRLDMDLPRRLLLLVGGNAQGKTSLLEAIYYLAAFTSFQTQNDRQLVNFLAGEEPIAVARLVADYQRGDRKHRIEVRLIQENAEGGSRFRKEVLQDGVKKTIHEVVGHFNAVLFLPQLTYMLDGGPEERRRYINTAASQAVPGYSLALSEYNQVVTQRNALLKLLFERKGDPEELAYWDELLAKRGAYLIYTRIQAVKELELFAARIHSRLTHGTEILRLDYKPAYDPVAQLKGQRSLPTQTPAQRTGIKEDEIANGFMEKLVSIRQEEIMRGVTTLGPHRDELRFLSNGMDLGDYGSRGQIRTTLLSLKLAEVSWLKERTGHFPVLLLDEILAELDGQRRSDLNEYLQECEQTLLTTTDLDQFEKGFLQQSTIWQVMNGQVSPGLP